MIKAKELKLFIEDTAKFKKKIKEELRAIDRGKAKKLREDSISFQSLDQLRKFLTPKRLELLRVIRHKKPKSIYGLAKLVNRTPENVNTDIKFLKQLGFVEVTKVKEIRKKSVPEVSYNKMTLEIAIGPKKSLHNAKWKEISVWVGFCQKYKIFLSMLRNF